MPWYLGHDSEIARLRIPIDDYVTISSENLAEYKELRTLVAEGAEPGGGWESDAAEYAPQVIHSLVTGTPRTIQVNTPNTGLISNLPQGAAVEVPATLDRLGVHPHYVGELPPAAGRAEPALLERGRSGRRGGGGRRSAAHPARGDGRPGHGSDADGRGDLEAVRRDGRGARGCAAGGIAARAAGCGECSVRELELAAETGAGGLALALRRGAAMAGSGPAAAGGIGLPAGCEPVVSGFELLLVRGVR